MNLHNAFIYRHFEVEHDFAALVSLLHDVEQIVVNKVKSDLGESFL